MISTMMSLRKILLLYGAHVDTSDRYGRTALMLVAGHDRDPDVLIALLDGGADADAKDRRGQAPLMLAAMCDPKPEVDIFLLDADADAKIRDRKANGPSTTRGRPRAQGYTDARTSGGREPLGAI